MKMKITKRAFMTWLRKQPPGRTFDFLDTDNCAAAAFAKEHLKAKDAMAGGWYVRIGHVVHEISPAVAKAILEVPNQFTAAQLLSELTK